MPCDACFDCGLLSQPISIGSRDRLFLYMSDYSRTPLVYLYSAVELGVLC
jgi:hypothetical protein